MQATVITSGERDALIQIRIQKAATEKEKDLDLSSLGLDTIPQEVFALEHLETLRFMNNLLEEIPYELTQMRNLQNLYLYNNKIRKVDERLLVDLPYLSCLDLGGNPFDYYAAVAYFYSNNPWQGYAKCVKEIVKAKEDKRERFYIFDEIHVFPKELFELADLTSLAIYGKHISTIPEGIRKLKKLKYLDLTGNKLSDLPEDIVELTELESISLTSNQFTAFPEMLLQMPALKKINISNNQLTYLDPAIILNDQFTDVYAFANPLTNFDSQLFNYGLEELRDQLRHRH